MSLKKRRLVNGMGAWRVVHFARERSVAGRAREDCRQRITWSARNLNGGVQVKSTKQSLRKVAEERSFAVAADPNLSVVGADSRHSG